jgi:hypothetical protein
MALAAGNREYSCHERDGLSSTKNGCPACARSRWGMGLFINLPSHGPPTKRIVRTVSVMPLRIPRQEGYFRNARRLARPTAKPSNSSPMTLSGSQIMSSQCGRYPSDLSGCAVRAMTTDASISTKPATMPLKLAPQATNRWCRKSRTLSSQYSFMPPILAEAGRWVDPEKKRCQGAPG